VIGPARCQPQPSPHLSRPASRYRVTITDRRGPPVSSIFPPNPPLLRAACPRRQNSRRRAVQPSSACTTSMSTCQPAVESCRISGGAPWHSIAAARCSAAARRCSSRDARARSSTTRSQAGCLILPCSILSLLANDCGSYCHLTSVAPSPFYCSAMP
jgi:hypothetical protein